MKNISEERFELICEVDSICSVLSDDVLCNVLERMRKKEVQRMRKKEKRVRFDERSKEYDGLHPFLERYVEVVRKYFNREIAEEDDILKIKNMTIANLEYICRLLHMLFIRLQENKSSMLLPEGGSDIKLLEGHSVSVAYLYRLCFNAMNKVASRLHT